MEEFFTSEWWSSGWGTIAGIFCLVLLWVALFYIGMRLRTRSLKATAHRLKDEIDARTRFERALQESEQRLALALSSAGLALCSRRCAAALPCMR